MRPMLAAAFVLSSCRCGSQAPATRAPVSVPRTELTARAPHAPGAGADPRNEIGDALPADAGPSASGGGAATGAAGEPAAKDAGSGSGAAAMGEKLAEIAGTLGALAGTDGGAEEFGTIAPGTVRDCTQVRASGPPTLSLVQGALREPPEKRAELLRGWACDQEAATRALATTLERALQADKPLEGLTPQDAQRALCGLPWSRALQLGARDAWEIELGCPPCAGSSRDAGTGRRADAEIDARANHAAGADGAGPARCDAPGATATHACLVAYALQLSRFTPGALPADVQRCRDDAEAAQAAWDARAALRVRQREEQSLRDRHPPRPDAGP